VGYLAIVATPEGQVVIDGLERGDSPGEWELPVGRHIVEVRRVGWIPSVDTVDVTAGNRIRLRPVLLKVDQ
jgi:hypothetical protein